MAVGSDDRAAYTAGVDVTLVRFISYVMTGLFAGFAGLMLTALIGSADPNIGPTYTLIAIAAVALGGVSLAGGRGGCLGAAIGAIDIFLLQSVLTDFNVSTFVLQIAYGVILVLAVIADRAAGTSCRDGRRDMSRSNLFATTNAPRRRRLRRRRASAPRRHGADRRLFGAICRSAPCWCSRRCWRSPRSARRWSSSSAASTCRSPSSSASPMSWRRSSTATAWNFVLVCGHRRRAGARHRRGSTALISRSLEIHPLIVTLGIGTVVQGAVLLWTAGFPSGSAPQAVSSFVSIGGSAGPLPVPWLVPSLRRAGGARRSGAGAHAVWPAALCAGQQSGRAPLALIDPVRMWTITYAPAPSSPPLAGVLLLGFTGSAYGDVGQPYLFQTIAAVVVGGAALVGGRGSYLGTHRRRAGADRDQHAADRPRLPALGGAGGTWPHHRAAGLALRPRTACLDDDLTRGGISLSWSSGQIISPRNSSFK